MLYLISDSNRKIIFNYCFLIALTSLLYGELPIISRPSWNYDARIDRKTSKKVMRPEFIILHFTANCSASKTIQIFRRIFKPVSTHFLIEPDGTIIQLVDESKRAWHAGKSSWQKNDQLNSYSIGIEIVNPGFTEKKEDPCSIFDQQIWNQNTSIQVPGSSFYWYPFTQKQIDSTIQLCLYLIKKYDISAHHILGHADITPGRKLDPGPLFPWKMLFEQGIGLWPQKIIPKKEPESTLDLQQKLQKFGYAIYPSGIPDSETMKVVQAFQMHFRPTLIDGIADSETVAILDNLLMQIS